MRVIFMGTPEFSVPALQALSTRHDIVAVYTQPPRPAGRGKQPRPSAVHQAAEKIGLLVRHPASMRDPQAQADLAALNADIFVVVAYGQILPQVVLDMPRFGCLNIHASLLPRWRGAAPIHRAVMAGDTETGICIMKMEAGLDTGPILLRAALPILQEDTTLDLHDRLANMGAELIVQALDTLPSLVSQPQSDTGITYATKIDKAESRIDWANDSTTISRQIMGLSPFPGAWCMAGTERLKLLRARSVAGQGAPGTVLPIPGLTVACGSGAVEITELQREGKRPQPTAQALNGFNLPEIFT